MFTKQLEEIGLNEKEAKIYVATLELGQGSAAEIAKKSGVNRATTYFTLENLMKIGLVSASNEEKKQLFVPEDPSQLENILEKQKQAIEQKRFGLKKLVGDLNSINSASVKKPIVKYYLGKEGIMRMASSSFNFTKDEPMWLAFSKDEMDNFISKEENEKLKQTRLKNKSSVRALYNSEQITLESDKDNTRIKINKSDYIFPGDIAVYKDKIRLTSYRDEIGIIIENKDIAETLKSIFKLAIKAAKK